MIRVSCAKLLCALPLPKILKPRGAKLDKINDLHPN